MCAFSILHITCMIELINGMFHAILPQLFAITRMIARVSFFTSPHKYKLDAEAKGSTGSRILKTYIKSREK